MNAASQDLPHHLAQLRERMLQPTDYELAVTYFLDEFAGDEPFVKQSEADDAPHLQEVLEHVAMLSMGRPVKFESARLLRLPGHKFLHGNATFGTRTLLYFYFEEADAGIVALIPGVRGAMEVGRFRLPAGLRNPRTN
jgi:hypothetical protein